MKKIIWILFAFATLEAKAQSDGARSNLPSPTGVWAVNVKYLNLDQNILPSGNLMLKNADINVNVLPITLIHTFAIGNTWARVFVMAAPVLSFDASTPINKIPINNIKKSGFSDGWVSLEVGLLGNPAKNIVQFSTTPPPKFTMNGLFRVWYSGSYDPDDFVNLGSNRVAFDFGLPMAIRLNNDVKKALWLETWPGIQVFTANNDPSIISRASKVTQRPLLYLENHLTYNITPKFYAGGDLRIQQGGQTLSDGVEDGNRLSLFAGGVLAGYKLLPYLDFWANYDGIISGDNGARSRMVRLSLVFSYVNVKKYQKATH